MCYVPWFRVLQACLIGITATQVLRADEFETSRLTGRVTDPQGKPIAGAKITFNRSSEAEIDFDTVRKGAVSDDDGRYQLAIGIKRGETLKIHEVWADAKDFARAAPNLDLRLKAGKTATLDFKLKPGLIFAGRLKVPKFPFTSLDRQKPQQLWFMLSGKNLTDQPLNSKLYATDNGTFALYLPAGEYTVEVGPITGYTGETHKWEKLSAGRDDLILEMPKFDWSEAALGKVFDEFWQVMDEEYSYFFLKPDVDWKKLGEEFRPKFTASKNPAEVAAVLQQMLGPLNDLHVWIDAPSGPVSTHRTGWDYNGNLDVVAAQLTDKTTCGKFALVGRTKPDGFGYFLMLRQGDANPENVKQAVAAIKKLADTPGFVVDLRRANGGSEPLAAEIAELFCQQETVYAKSKYRSGPGHDEFTPEYPRTLPATKDAYTKPVVCLIGPGAVSSGEGFVKMMQCLPHVTTIGLPTRGASGNPQPWPLGRTGVAVYFSRWVDLLPDGQTFEGRGIPPDVEVKVPATAYQSADPTLEKGLDILREKIVRDSR